MLVLLSCEISASRTHRFTSIAQQLKINKPNTDLERFLYFFHRFIVKMCNFISEPLFVYCTNLFQQDDGIPLKSVRFRINFDVCWELGFLDLCRDRSDDDRRRKTIADVILDDKHRTYPPLLRPDNGR